MSLLSKRIICHPENVRLLEAHLPRLGLANVGPFAKYCPTCRPAMRRPKRRKYIVDEKVKRLLTERYDSRVRGRVAEIAAELGWPGWAVKKVARRLGLAKPWSKDRRDWTPDEEDYLRTWQGLRSAAWIGKQLERGETSVILKMKHMGLSRRIRDGYSVNEVANCMGVDHKCVDRWLEQGWLAAVKQGTKRRHDIRRISAADLLAFLQSRREEYRLDKVDQAWFLELVFGEAKHRGSVEAVRDRLQIIEARRGNDPSPATIRDRAAAVRRGWTDKSGIMAVPPNASSQLLATPSGD